MSHADQHSPKEQNQAALFGWIADDQGEGDWYGWASDLIDWAGYTSEGVYTDAFVGIIYSRSLEVGVSLNRFLCAFQPHTNERCRQLSITPPLVSQSARVDMLKMLRKIRNRDLRGYENFTGGVLWVPYRVTTESRLAFEGTSHQRLTLKLADRQRRARLISEELERFALKYPADRFLGGYARLYAAVLRMNWTNEVDATASALADIEARYREIPSIGIMSAWYRAVLLYYYKRPEARQAFSHVVQRYGNHDWWVVHKARELMHEAPGA